MKSHTPRMLQRFSHRSENSEFHIRLPTPGVLYWEDKSQEYLAVKDPDRLEPESSGLRFLEPCPVTSPPTNQEKVTHATAPFPNSTYKNSSLNITGEFRSVNRSQATPSPCVVLSLLQTLMFGFIWPPCASGIWCTCRWCHTLTFGNKMSQ